MCKGFALGCAAALLNPDLKFAQHPATALPMCLADTSALLPLLLPLLLSLLLLPPQRPQPVMTLNRQQQQQQLAPSGQSRTTTTTL